MTASFEQTLTVSKLQTNLNAVFAQASAITLCEETVCQHFWKHNKPDKQIHSCIIEPVMLEPATESQDDK